jgi:hypothetical protein
MSPVRHAKHPARPPRLGIGARAYDQRRSKTMHMYRATRWVLLLSLAACLATAAVAADNAAVVGTWKISTEMQGQPVEMTMEIKEADGALTGTWTSPRGSDPMSDVKWDGQELSWSRTVSRQGQEFKIQSTAKITGDTLEGKMKMPQREIPFTGKKAS